MSTPQYGPPPDYQSAPPAYQPAPPDYQSAPPAYQPAPFAYQPAPPPQKPSGTNGFAVAALCLGIIPVFAGIPAIVFGSIALSQIRKTGQNGKGLAIAGLSMVGVWVLVAATLFAVQVSTKAKRDQSGTITAAGDVLVDAIRVGDCLKDLKPDGSLVEVAAVPCAQPHTGEVVGGFRLSGLAYPDEQAMEKQAITQCELLLAGYSSRSDEVDDFYFLYPSRQDWSRGDRGVTCIAYYNSPVSGSLRG